MSATTCFILTLSVTLFSIVVAGSCHAYTAGVKHPYQICFRPQFCCGSCSFRYCCSNRDLEFDDDDQDKCESPRNMSADVSAITGSVVGLIILITVIVSCCLCPCCCLYNMCRKPRPLATTTHTTTVMQTAYVPAPAPVQPSQGGPYPGYQHVPIAAPGVQPMPPGQYPTQPYHPAGPPPYQDPGMAYPPPQAPYTQPGYSMGQPAYPLQPPAHTSYPPAPPVQMDYTATQPPYNPAFVDPPKTGY